MFEDKYFKLDIVTIEEQIYSGRVKSLVAPGSDGYLGVLPGHTPLVTVLGRGKLSFVEVPRLDAKASFEQSPPRRESQSPDDPATSKAAKDERSFNINGGFMEVTQHKVIVFVDEMLGQSSDAKADAGK
jgi:F0F1-type ATP synthase epsilon subunit